MALSYRVEQVLCRAHANPHRVNPHPASPARSLVAMGAPQPANPHHANPYLGLKSIHTVLPSVPRC